MKVAPARLLVGTESAGRCRDVTSSYTFRDHPFYGGRQALPLSDAAGGGDVGSPASEAREPGGPRLVRQGPVRLAGPASCVAMSRCARTNVTTTASSGGPAGPAPGDPLAPFATLPGAVAASYSPPLAATALGPPCLAPVQPGPQLPALPPFGPGSGPRCLSYASRAAWSVNGPRSH